MIRPLRTPQNHVNRLQAIRAADVVNWISLACRIIGTKRIFRRKKRFVVAADARKIVLAKTSPRSWNMFPRS